MAVIGVDIGTTSTKVITYDRNGGILAEEFSGYEMSSAHPGRAEQNPGEILEAVLGSLTGAANAVRRDGGEVTGVSFSAAMHSLLALDKDGNPLTPSLTYADNRSLHQATRIRDELDGAGIHRRTGTPVHPMSPLTKILWFREEEADTFEAAARWVSIKEYVFFRLFGEYVVDYSIAEIADRLGLDADTPFVIGANDGVLANLGLGAVDPGVVACSIGTSGAVRSVVDWPQVDDGRKLFCYALTEGKWIIGGPINNGGIALQWALQELFPGLIQEAEEKNRNPHEMASELAGEVPAGSEGLIFLPYLTGERAPY